MDAMGARPTSKDVHFGATEASGRRERHRGELPHVRRTGRATGGRGGQVEHREGLRGTCSCIVRIVAAPTDMAIDTDFPKTPLGRERSAATPRLDRLDVSIWRRSVDPLPAATRGPIGAVGRTVRTAVRVAVRRSAQERACACPRGGKPRLPRSKQWLLMPRPWSERAPRPRLGNSRRRRSALVASRLSRVGCHL